MIEVHVRIHLSIFIIIYEIQNTREKEGKKEFVKLKTVDSINNQQTLLCRYGNRSTNLIVNLTREWCG